MKMRSARDNITWNLIIHPRKTIQRAVEEKHSLPFLLIITVLIGFYPALATLAAGSFSTGGGHIAFLLVSSGILALAGLYITAFFTRILAKWLFKGKGTMGKMVRGVGLGNVIILIPLLFFGSYSIITGDSPIVWRDGGVWGFNIFEAIGLIFALWHFIIISVAVMIVEKIQWWKALVTMIGVFCVNILLFFIAAVLLAMFFAFFISPLALL